MSKKTTLLSPRHPDDRERLKAAQQLGLHGVVARWDEVGSESWLTYLIEIEAAERARRSLERRRRSAKLTRFKSLADFNWSWPKVIDRAHIEELMSLTFIADATNVVLIGPNGVGKSMIAQNIADAAILAGKRIRFGTAAEILNDLSAQPTPRDLERRIRRYINPDLLVIDEVGYLASAADHGDLLFQIVNRRYERRSTIITTNKSFREWSSVFPSSGCVSTMVDRLVHHSEIISIDGDSYRLYEAEQKKMKKRRTPKPKSSEQEE